MSARRSLTTPHAPTPTRGDDWRDLAACRWQDPELFHPPGNSWQRHRAQAAAAKAICEACPVRALCLEDALDRGDEHAILGGLTPRQRRDLRSARRKEATA